VLPRQRAADTNENRKEKASKRVSRLLMDDLSLLN
jgi:hypothetical protein